MRALTDIHAGRMVLLVGDDEAAGGNLLIAADRITPGAVNFMAREGRGLIRLALPASRCDRLGLRLQTVRGVAPRGSERFMVSIEARHGVSTGISAADRAHTIRVATDPLATAQDIVQPGHVFPVRAADGGVLERRNEAEAAVDLTRAAGRSPAAVLCDVLDDDGALAGRRALRAFAARHDLAIVTLDEAVAFLTAAVCRSDAEEPVTVRRPAGAFTVYTYRSVWTGAAHVALVKGDVRRTAGAAVRVHRECVAAAIPGTMPACDCRARLERSLAEVEAAGAGVVVYLRTPDRAGHAHEPLDANDHAVAAQIVADVRRGAAPIARAIA